MGGGSNDAAVAGDVVTVSSVDGHSALVDEAGKTLYSASVEASGSIKCVDTCTTFWAPEMATAKQAHEASDDLGATFGVVDRPDGGSQLTYKGAPLYTFAEEGAGELKGNGFTDDFQGSHFTWSAAWTGASGAGAPATTPDSNQGGGYGY